MSINIKNGGWHLSCFCDKYLIKNKLENFSHIEYNIPKYTNLETIQEKIDNTIDLFDRDDYHITFIDIKIMIIYLMNMINILNNFLNNIVI